jgi:putative RNA 2'-phosphotransferase
LEPIDPPELLYHGTVERFVQSIMSEGLRPGARQHVNLSLDKSTAAAVGLRRGPPVILAIRAEDMKADGHTFYCSTNGVWLTDQVPPKYIELQEL